MTKTSLPLLRLTAEDLMVRDIVLLSVDMSLREAAELLLHHQVGGAPVVDAEGVCVGVLSATDFLRLAHRRVEISKPLAPPLPITCSFQSKRQRPDGKELTLCTLPPGVCPLQVKESSLEGEPSLVCGQPHCVLVDWQVVDVEKLPADAVRNFMTPDPVLVRPSTGIRTLARMMVDAHIHRLIVVDESRRPVGIVSSTDLLAALARCD